MKARMTTGIMKRFSSPIKSISSNPASMRKISPLTYPSSVSPNIVSAVSLSFHSNGSCDVSHTSRASSAASFACCIFSLVFAMMGLFDACIDRWAFLASRYSVDFSTVFDRLSIRFSHCVLCTSFIMTAVVPLSFAIPSSPASASAPSPSPLPVLLLLLSSPPLDSPAPVPPPSVVVALSSSSSSSSAVDAAFAFAAASSRSFMILMYSSRSKVRASFIIWRSTRRSLSSRDWPVAIFSAYSSR
mmetsp:Transcript_7908/g.10859  ORF Transcript_7908/g.10859 Transcript_7908/m.10859 type:complete len:244 (-) Transcript_7908:443-1174(-)